MALQHLRSSTANKRPTPGAMADGQLAINTEATSPGLFFKDASGALVKTGPVHIGSTAPNATPASGGQAGNSVGEQWLDTSGSTYTLKVWDGSAWRIVLNVSATDRLLGRSSAGAGVIEEITCTAAGRALLDDADAAAQRSTLGLGTISTQAANNVAITGGSISGITDLAIADGGTGASTAADARTNLGLAIGTNVQAYNANTAFTNTVQAFSVAQRGTVSALTSASTITADFSAANNFSLTLGHNVTLANPSNLTAGQSGAIVITQSSGTAYTVAYGANWKFSGGTPTMSTGLSSVSVLVYYVESASRITAQLLTNVA